MILFSLDVHLLFWKQSFVIFLTVFTVALSRLNYIWLFFIFRHDYLHIARKIYIQHALSELLMTNKMSTATLLASNFCDGLVFH